MAAGATPKSSDGKNPQEQLGEIRTFVRAMMVDQAKCYANLRGELARQYPAVSLGPGYTWERGLVKLPFAINLAVPSFDLNRAAIRAAGRSGPSPCHRRRYTRHR